MNIYYVVYLNIAQARDVHQHNLYGRSLSCACACACVCVCVCVCVCDTVTGPRRHHAVNKTSIRRQLEQCTLHYLRMFHMTPEDAVLTYTDYGTDHDGTSSVTRSTSCPFRRRHLHRCITFDRPINHPPLAVSVANSPPRPCRRRRFRLFGRCLSWAQVGAPALIWCCWLLYCSNCRSVVSSSGSNARNSGYLEL